MVSLVQLPAQGSAGAGTAAQVLLQAAGGLVVVVTLVDIFFTVLSPGSGHGPLRRPMSQVVWRTFRAVARRLPPARRRNVLTYSGPVLVGLSIAVWPVLLVSGWALVYHPALGTGFVASSGPTSRDWPAAFYVSGFSLTTLGTGDIAPATGFWRCASITEAAVGFAVVTMVITYFLSLYGAITQRKAFASGLHHRTHDTGDSARLVVALMAQGGTSALVWQLSSTGEFLEHVFQTHQSYPVLRYFHFREVRYSLPRLLLVTLDAAALLAAALRGDDRRQMSGGAATALLSGAAEDLLHELVPHAFPVGAGGDGHGAGEESRWRRRFAVAVEQFRAAGLDVRSDDDAAEDYVTRRRGWDGPLRTLAADMLYEWDEIEEEAPCRRAG